MSNTLWPLKEWVYILFQSSNVLHYDNPSRFWGRNASKNIASPRQFFFETGKKMKAGIHICTVYSCEPKNIQNIY